MEADEDVLLFYKGRTGTGLRFQKYPSVPLFFKLQVVTKCDHKINVEVNQNILKNEIKYQSAY